MNKPNRSKYSPQSKTPITPASELESAPSRSSVADLRAVFAQAGVPLHCTDATLEGMAASLTPAMLQRMNTTVSYGELQALAEGFARSEETRGTRASPQRPSIPPEEPSEPSPATREALALALSRRGKPVEYSDELFTRICLHIASGYTNGAACARAGLLESTLNEWRRADPDLDSVISIARELHRAQQLENIMKASASGNWRASIALLKLSFPEDYTPRSRRKPATPPPPPADAPIPKSPPSDTPSGQNTLAKGIALERGGIGGAAVLERGVECDRNHTAPTSPAPMTPSVPLYAGR